MVVDFRTSPDEYRHWKFEFEPPLAFLYLDVDAGSTLLPGYELKLNSYDLGVDIELHDAVQRLRFEHPEVGAVVICSSKERVFCAGANIHMLALADHAHKVNFCKFTNETRNAIEDASACSGQVYLSAINGAAAGGGYELALATEHILLVDDGAAAVSLPEVPVLGVLPGTGGLTRLVDKRRVRRDRADQFCTAEEGIRGRRAVEWHLVDETVPTSRFASAVRERALERARRSDRPRDADGIVLRELARDADEAGMRYRYLRVAFDRGLGIATVTLHGPDCGPMSFDRVMAEGSDSWPLALARELDDALLYLRFNEPALGTLVFRCEGDAGAVAACDRFLSEHRDHWLIREVLLYWKRVLKRIDVTSRSLLALVEPRSCFCGFLAEVLLAADRSYMLDGRREDDTGTETSIRLSELNFGTLPMGNGLARLETRFLGEPDRVKAAKRLIGRDLKAGEALAAGLVTVALDDVDWDDEIRLLLEERASFSPDALTGMEANLRFAGPETLETKIFARLSAWQNWIFQRPNATGADGALNCYGTGRRPGYDPRRV